MASVRHRTIGAAPARPAELTSGEIVWASIVNGIENPAARGKSRPAILVEPNGYAWKTIGLTTRRHHRDGTPRVAIPNARAVGLRQPGWLWSGRLCTTSGIDITDHIGWVDQALVFEVAKLAEIDGPTIKTLMLAALTHHKPAASPVRLVDGVQP
jgi:hypothetical protein